MMDREGGWDRIFFSSNNLDVVFLSVNHMCVTQRVAVDVKLDL